MVLLHCSRRRVFLAALFLAAIAGCLGPRPAAAQENIQNYVGPGVAMPCYSSTNPNVLIRYCTEAINSDLADLVGIGLQGFQGALDAMRYANFSHDLLVEAYSNRASAYAMKGNLNQALADYDQALRIDADSVDALVGRGIAYATMQEYDKAVRDYSRAINLAPYFAVPLTDRGAVYDLLDKHDLALRDYNQAVRLDPESSSVYNNRGLAYSGAKDYDRAVKDFDHAIKLDPNYKQAYANCAAAYQNKGDHQRAILDFQQVLKIDPTNAAAKSALAKLQAGN